MSQIQLQGKKILITGVRRPVGIGATLARRFAEAGASVAVHGYSRYDCKMQYADAQDDATQVLTDSLLGEDLKMVADMFPSGRWGTSDDAADLALFLHSDYSKWITGQVIASEGGFRRDVIV